MPPVRGSEPHHRVEWWAGVSLGNVLTIVASVLAAGVAYGAIKSQQEAQDKRIDDQAQAIREVDERRRESVEQLRSDIARVETKIDRLLLEVSKR